jgi:2-C-methyl-D-erythritol 4-phosphate cytidylyltransferase
MNDAVVIVAAGSGQRMGERNKALLPIAGEPMLVHSIRAAAALERIGSIVVVTRDDLIEEIAQLASDLEIDQLISIVTGGDTRTESVLHGVRKAASLSAPTVAVHDAARPLVTSGLFAAVLGAADDVGAAIAAVPVVDTLKRVDAMGRIVATVDRTDLWSAQTPQAFRTMDLLHALEAAVAVGTTLTDESGLYEALGLPVAIVGGDRTNLKVTHPADHALASFLFERQHRLEGSGT